MAKNSFKANRKLPRDLQIGDPIFVVKSNKMTEDTLSGIKFYDLESGEVEELRKDKKKDREGYIIINDSISVPGDGMGLRELGEGDLIVDEQEARDTVIRLIKLERNKALKAVERATNELKGIESNLAIFEGKKTLNTGKGQTIIFAKVEGSSLSNEEDNEEQD